MGDKCIMTHPGSHGGHATPAQQQAWTNQGWQGQENWAPPQGQHDAQQNQQQNQGNQNQQQADTSKGQHNPNYKGQKGNNQGQPGYCCVATPASPVGSSQYQNNSPQFTDFDGNPHATPEEMINSIRSINY